MTETLKNKIEEALKQEPIETAEEFEGEETHEVCEEKKSLKDTVIGFYKDHTIGCRIAGAAALTVAGAVMLRKCVLKKRVTTILDDSGNVTDGDILDELDAIDALGVEDQPVMLEETVVTPEQDLVTINF